MSPFHEPQIEYVVDKDGQKKAVLVDYNVWEELLTRLEDLEDALEIQYLRDLNEETLPWEQVKAELGLEGDV